MQCSHQIVLLGLKAALNFSSLEKLAANGYLGHYCSTIALTSVHAQTCPLGLVKICC